MEQGRAADGRRSVRLTAHSATPEVELQSGWVALEAGLEYHLRRLSAPDRLGLQATFSALAPDGTRATVDFAPTADWRRYDAAFTVAAAGWRCFAIGPAGGAPVHDPGSIFVDAVRLDAGRPSPRSLSRCSAPRCSAGLGCAARATGLSSSSGSRVQGRARREAALAARGSFQPGARPRLAPDRAAGRRAGERPGPPRSAAARRLSLAGDGRFNGLRLARRHGDGGELGARRPGAWFGVQGAWGGRGLSALELMRSRPRAGLIPVEDAEVPFGPLYARPRARVTGVGYLPERGDTAAVAGPRAALPRADQGLGIARLATAAAARTRKPSASPPPRLGCGRLIPAPSACWCAWRPTRPGWSA